MFFGLDDVSFTPINSYDGFLCELSCLFLTLLSSTYTATQQVIKLFITYLFALIKLLLQVFSTIVYAQCSNT